MASPCEGTLILSYVIDNSINLERSMIACDTKESQYELLNMNYQTLPKYSRKLNLITVQGATQL
ncbi:hypothetical protein TUM19329_13830 [Legionella antarctica]|uniref:Uncharacterized protein n=1 Tax=Legionella antarctica TaxID=2708020 RepID=A0A6F8T4S1_9GAMM|nr:hypothetical protein TUM19329_13830 [Legionella antarctica]